MKMHMNLGKMMSLTMAAWLVGGCAMNKPHGQVTIGVSEEVVAVVAKNKVAFNLSPVPSGSDWHFQWETNGVDIPNETSPKLILQKVDRKNTAIYRCRIYTTQNGPETNYTPNVELQVMGLSLMKLTTTTTPVSGILQTTTPPTTTCPNSTYGYVRYKCATKLDPSDTTCRDNSIWWCFPQGTTLVTVKNTTPNIHAKIEVIRSTDLKPVADCATDQLQFVPTAGVKYEFILYATAPLPANTTLTAEIVWTK